MNSDEVRTAFLKFFEEKEHKVIPSSSLIPRDDPTLLLTTAGMVQIKPYFLGKETPPSPRLASCQKCFRTTDIESVGDASHCTFFEMLGNFSVGDYFKREAIHWAWEFVTQRLQLAPERLWITIFLDDDESFVYWLEVGVPRERILRFGEEDNFWDQPAIRGPADRVVKSTMTLGKSSAAASLLAVPIVLAAAFPKSGTWFSPSIIKTGKEIALRCPSLISIPAWVWRGLLPPSRAKPPSTKPTSLFL